MLTQEVISQVRLKFGNAGLKELDEFTLRNELFSVVSLKLAQQNISTQNIFLQMTAFQLPINAQDYLALPGDFGSAVFAECSYDNGICFSPIQIVNFNELPDFAGQSELAVAIYGRNPQVMRTSYKPQQPIQFRLWYEPDLAPSKDPQAAVRVPNLFTSMIVVDTALNCLPFAAIAPEVKAELEKSLLRQKGEWQSAWVKEMFRAKTPGKQMKRGYGMVGQPVRRGWGAY